ncbi:allantoicase-like isoform X2 [Panulirus ornatus]|uniref:allantoicase-like isoform X2 n=1 Tax=Panulirus ornatus TaxID=150431 RepID=UPI003A846455
MFISSKLGGRVLFATDDWFAVAENLLKESLPEWREGEFTECGKWMDGWETRRRRKPGHDWCIIKLGVPGVIEGVDVDTSYFTGNFAPRVSLQATVLSEQDEAIIPERRSVFGTEASNDSLIQMETLHSEKWETIIPMTDARPGYRDTCHTYMPSTSNHRFTHVRFNIFPDGGVARLKVFGFAVPDWSLVAPSQLLDLAGVSNGGVCLEYSDAHYGHPRNLISPGRGVTMADGWETARRLDRPPVLVGQAGGVLAVAGFEWTVLRLGHPGKISRIEIDTHHFKGNFPDSCRIDGCFLQSQQKESEGIGTNDSLWQVILPPQKMRAHSLHHYESEALSLATPVSHVRIVMAPDGGISRVRIFGHIVN